MRIYKGITVVAIVTTIMISVSFNDIAASSIMDETFEMISFDQFDLDTDKMPDSAVIMAKYVGLDFKIVIYDQGSNMRWSDNWREGTDFENDIWLFQTATGENTRLIIRFSQTHDDYMAELFDDSDGDGNVDFQVRNLTSVEVLESSFPTMIMTAQQPWILPDGRVNYIVGYTLKRPLPVPFMQPQYFQYLPAAGSITYEHELVDSDDNGIPDYELSRAFPNPPENIFVFRSQIIVNVDNGLRPNFEEAFFWPYLGEADSENWSVKQIQRRPEDISPPIKMDWQTGQINGVSALLPFFGLGNQWRIMTTKPIEKQKVNELDWEVFAYYDFTDDNITDMLVRLIHQPVEPVRVGMKTYHLQQTSIAWHHRNLETLQWDYELETASLREKPSSVVEFQDFSVHTIPYEELPSLFGPSQDWAFVTFVAAESNPYSSNEGIWEWGTLEGVQTDLTLTPEERFVPDAMQGQHDYLRGLVETSPSIYYNEIREGFRGEYAELNGPAQLYLSPVDRKLHLHGAQKGIWNLSGPRDLYYESLDGEYINHWSLYENSELLEELYFLNGLVIYQHASGIDLIQTDDSPALFFTQPPRDRAEWEQLDVQLTENQPVFAPDDFVAMLRQFSVPSLSISAASIRDIRQTSSGLRFVLELQPGFSFTGKSTFAGTSLQPGEYVVGLEDRDWRIRPLSPGKINLELEFSSASSGMQTLNIRGSNSGLADIFGAKVQVIRACAVEEPAFFERDFDFLAGETQEISVVLPPSSEQNCMLNIRVLDHSGQLLTGTNENFPGSSFDNNLLLSQAYGLGHQLPVYGFLGMLVFLTISFVVNLLPRKFS